MLGVNVIYKMNRGMRASFLSEIAACGVQQAIRQEAGCLQYDYFLSAEDEDSLLLLEKWTDEAAQKLHMTQSHMAQVAAIKVNHVAETALEFYQL